MIHEGKLSNIIGVFECKLRGLELDLKIFGACDVNWRSELFERSAS